MKKVKNIYSKVMKKNVVSVKDLLQTCCKCNNNHDKKQEKRWSKCTQLIESNMQKKNVEDDYGDSLRR